MTRDGKDNAMAAKQVKHGLLLILCVVLLVATPQVEAQAYLTTIGSPPFTAAAPVESGSVNLANGNLRIAIPIVSASQRGKRTFSAGLVYESRLWNVVTGSSKTWQPTNVANSQGGWRFVTSADPGTESNSQSNSYCTYMGSQIQYSFTKSNFQWVEPSGVVHSFAISTGKTWSVPCYSGSSDNPSGSAYASDSSGYYMSVINYGQATVYAPDGTQVNPTVKDPNGNYFSTDSHGNIIDTLGRVQVTKTVNGSTTYYDVLNSQGSTSRYTVTTATVNVNTNFGQSGVTEYSGSFSAVQSITLPDNTSYSFTYDSGTTAGNFGLLKTMTIPAGGQITYGFTTFQDSTGNRNRWLNTRTAQTGTWSGSWTYSPAVIATCTVGQSTCQQKVTLTQPTAEYVVHTFSLDSSWLGAWDTQQQTYDSSSNLMMTGTTTYDTSHGNSYTVPLSTQLTMPVPGSSSISRQTKYVYDSSISPNERVTAVKEWAWYAGTSPSYPSTPDRETDTAYVTNYSYISRLPSSITVNGASGMVSQVKFSYDDSTHLTSKTGVVNHDDTNFSTSFTTRGNPTLIQRWVTGSTYLSGNIYYDTTGQVTQTTDPANNSLTYQYGDDKFFSDNGANPPTTYTPSVVTNAYLSQVNLPITGSQTFGYYYNTGKHTFKRDQNGADVYAHFIDPLDRNSHVYGPLIAGNREWALKAYTGQTLVDAYRTRTDTTPSVNCTNCVHKQVQGDGLKRVTRSVLVSDPEGAVNRDRSYDSSGRLQSATNPYRSTSDPTYGTSQPSYDALNRPTSVTLQDANVKKVFYGDKVSTSGISSQLCSSSTYGLGYPLLFVDEASKKRQVWKDGLGRLIEVDEPDPSTGALNLNTCYSYDAVNNIKTIVQGSQTRSFVVDGLSRLTSQTLPESGTTTFSYTNTSGQYCAGNATKICSKTDARNVKTTYAYDALNRLTSKSFSDSTPTVTYMYDQTSYNGLTITNGVGRLTGIKETSGSTTLGMTAWSFDAAGRVVTEQKSVGTVTKTTTYSRNLDGSVSSVTYPSGHSFAYTYSNADRPLSVQDSSTGVYYAQNATYAPHGKLTGVVYGKTGSFAGITRARTYNNRLQSTRITDSSPNGTIKDLSYSFDLGSGVDNGYVSSVTDNAVQGRSQTYTYDYMNRLATAKTQATSGSDCWGQGFTYDRYGNLSNVAATQCSAPTLSLAINAASNQITGGGVTYDSNGNMTNDGSQAYIFDGENRVASAAGVSYTYDGLGRRVQKSSGEMEWRSRSRLLSETDSSGNLTNEYIYFAGRQIARKESSGTVLYYSSDRLRSNRVMTDSNGNTLQASDFYPYGAEHVLANQLDNRHKFTGKKRDSESGVDHADYRNYHPNLARWLGVDPAKPMLSNPQSLNRYTYVLSDPVNLIDPDGRCQQPPGLQAGEVGVCIDSYIAAPTIGPFPGIFGLGDDRGPDPNGGSYRTEYQLVYSPSSGQVTYYSADAGVSDVVCPICTWPIASSPGDLQGNISTTYNSDGTATVIINTQASNGFSGVPFAPSPIMIDMPVTFSPNSNVSTTGSSSSFPSLEGWVYQQGQVPYNLLSMPETNPSNLGSLNQEIPYASTGGTPDATVSGTIDQVPLIPVDNSAVPNSLDYSGGGGGGGGGYGGGGDGAFLMFDT